MSDKIHRIGAGLAAWLILTCAISAGLCEHSRAEKVVLTGTDFSAWLASSDWTIAGNTSLHPRNENLLTTEEGTGVIVNGRRANSPPLVSKNTYGDMRAHIEFVIPKGASSGIYFQGQYKLQISDSWGEANSLYPGAECGGIYPRWDDERLVKMYEGRSPKLNASRPPGQWQSFDVIFKAPRFDNEGRKIAHARFLKVLHNGTLIHENVELSGPSWGSLYPQERATGPIALQGDRGPVAFRNIWVVPIDLDKMGLTNPFFAMDTGTIDDVHQSTKSQAEMLKELGYAGIGYWERNPAGGTKGLAEMLGELDKCALKMYPVYF